MNDHKEWSNRRSENVLAAEKEQVMMLIDLIKKWTLALGVDKSSINNWILDLVFHRY